MFTPYDWQEGIGNRAQYIEAKLAHGAPVIAASLREGILVFTYRRQAHKIYEVYDRLVFAGIGQQADIESLRTAAVEFSHQEGYNRSEQDVTIQRVATALSAPLKKAFADFSTVPFVARSLFGEVAENPEQDLYYVVDYDGNYSVTRHFAAIAGRDEITSRIRERMSGFNRAVSVESGIEALKKVWADALDPEEEQPDETQTGNLLPEAVLLERAPNRDSRFRYLTPEEI